MGPDGDYEVKLKKAEQEKLASFTSKLSEDDKKALHKEGQNARLVDCLSYETGASMAERS